MGTLSVEGRSVLVLPPRPEYDTTRVSLTY